MRATRQHHAIEHATLHVLAERAAVGVTAGISDPAGFTLLGDVSLEQAEQAVATALEALQQGQAHLAIHPNCGTNLLTQAFLSLVAARLLLTPRRTRSLNTQALALAGFLGVSVMGHALGARMQLFTTLADVRDRRIAHIYPVSILGRRGLRVQIAAHS